MLWAWLGECGQGSGGLGMSWGWELLYLPREGTEVHVWATVI